MFKVLSRIITRNGLNEKERERKGIYLFSE
jgi:hypothetical protein